MKKIVLLTTFLMSLNVFASNFQLGFVLGGPTGISGKVELGNNRAIDGVIAYSLADDLGLEMHADYLVEKARSFTVGTAAPLELYYGIGARIVDIRKGSHDGDLGFGPRAPIGVSMDINNPNLQFFGELAIAFDIIPTTNADLEGGLGIRYRF